MNTEPSSNQTRRRPSAPEATVSSNRSLLFQLYGEIDLAREDEPPPTWLTSPPPTLSTR